jgi:hypothetical protein
VTTRAAQDGPPKAPGFSANLTGARQATFGSSQRAAWPWRGPIASQANVKIGKLLSPLIRSRTASPGRSIGVKMGEVIRQAGEK